jgi:Cu(I)/Ag(I) efflux system membrane fusion protein
MTWPYRILLGMTALIAASGGYWLGRDDGLPRWIGFQIDQSVAPTQRASPARPTAGGAIVYFRDPDGKPAYSDTPKQTADGRPYVAVHAGEDVSFDIADESAMPHAQAERRPLYYRHPMGLPDVSSVPRKDNMGMDYIPVYAGDGPSDDGTVRLSPERIQKAGVRTAMVERRALARSIQVPGTIQVDESRIKIVTLRGEGFIEELYVNRTGESLKAGQPLFRVYMPQLQEAQVDLLLALNEVGRAPAAQERLIQGAAQKLRNLGVPESFVKSVIETRRNLRTIDWPSPMSGVVLEKRVIEGQRAMAGEELYRLADLNSVWLVASVPEQELGTVKIGDTVTVRFRALGDETREAKVTFIYPDIDTRTRTGRLRIELPNVDAKLRLDMYGDVTIRSGAARVLAVPETAFLDDGDRRVVLVAKGEGRFEPRAVRARPARRRLRRKSVEGLAGGRRRW